MSASVGCGCPNRAWGASFDLICGWHPAHLGGGGRGQGSVMWLQVPTAPTEASVGLLAEAQERLRSGRQNVYQLCLQCLARKFRGSWCGACQQCLEQGVWLFYRIWIRRLEVLWKL